MAFLSGASLFSLLLFAQRPWALQVTPNSPCAQYCLDDPSEDPSDPNSSNTYASDITCSDTSYGTTAVGQKFESCVSCLQNSSSTNSGESDQAWFIYNLRYTLSSCLFDFSNATDAISTPCSASESCGPLQQALDDGNVIPTNETTYSYCSIDDNAVLGSLVDKCVSCLRSGGTELYLANFLLALYAGCQQPPAGTNIGIQGTVFSTERINAIYPGYNSNSRSSKKKHSLSAGAIVGIVAGFIGLLVIIYAIFFIACRKRREAKRLKVIQSPLHSRFGAINITAPNNGAYRNTYTVPAVPVAAVNDDSREGGSRALSRPDSPDGAWTRGGRNTNQQVVSNIMASTVGSVNPLYSSVWSEVPRILLGNHVHDLGHRLGTVYEHMLRILYRQRLLLKDLQYSC